MKNTILGLLLPALLLVSCKPEFDEINYGHDACAQCKMTIIDKRYAAEILTKKGKAYKFDDIACLRKHIAAEQLKESELTIFVADFRNPDNKFMNAHDVVYLHGDSFKSPMNGNTAAFSIADNAASLSDSMHTKLLRWENLN